MKRLLVVFCLALALLLVPAPVVLAVADSGQEGESGLQSEKTLQSIGAEEGVEIEAEKKRYGLKVTRFDTNILDKQGKCLIGLEGLAMLLVDVDSDGEFFDMERAVFARDISEGGGVTIPGLTESVAIIAIDKHGNESKVYKVEGRRLKVAGEFNQPFILIPST